MNLKFLNRNHHLTLSLVKKDKLDSGKYKDVVLTRLGTFPDSLNLISPTMKTLLHRLVKVVETEEKDELMKQSLNDDDLVSLLNNQLDQDEVKLVNLSILFIDKVLQEFDLKDYFDQLQKQTKKGYSLYNVFKFIVSMNIISPDSLLAYFYKQKDYLLQSPGEEIKLADLYDFLTFFYEHRYEIQKKLFETTIKVLGKQPVQIYFYDGTNFTFSVSKADPDHLDRLDNIVRKGLRQFGIPKNKRTDRPCVGLGIIATDLEIPLFFTVFPGSDQEITHIQEDIKHLTNSLFSLNINQRAIITADAGLYSGDLIFRLAGKNDTSYRKRDGYAIGRSINKVDQETREWALDWTGYYPVSRRKNHYHKRQRSKVTWVKSRVVTIETPVKLKDGRTVKKKVQQKQIAIFSEKRQHRALETIQEEIEKSEKYTGSSKRIQSFLKKRLAKFTSFFGVFDSTGELTDELKGYFNEAALEESVKRAGFFIITTSETDWPDGRILHIYREKNKIEHLIRTLKQVIKASPVYVYTYEHIVSHFNLSVISLIILNFIQVITTHGSDCNLTSERIQHQLQKFEATSLRSDVYIIPALCKELKTLLRSFNIDLTSGIKKLKAIMRAFELK